MRFLLITNLLILLLSNCFSPDSQSNSSFKVKDHQDSSVRDSILGLEYEHILIAYSSKDCSHCYGTLLELKNQMDYPVVFVFKRDQVRTRVAESISQTYSAESIIDNALYNFIIKESGAEPLTTGIIHVKSGKVKQAQSLMDYNYSSSASLNRRDLSKDSL